MRRYDALSHNSYLHAVGPFHDVENGASGTSRTLTCKDSMGRESKFGPGLLAGGSRRLPGFVGAGGGDGAEGFHQRSRSWVSQAPHGTSRPTQSRVERLNRIKDEREHTARERSLQRSHLVGNSNQRSRLVEREDPQADGFVR